MNLLVTYEPVNRFLARDEVEQVLRGIGDIIPTFVESRVRGLFMIHVAKDPKAVTILLDALCRRDPSMFWYTYHWVPIETWCPATIEAMAAVVKAFATRIDPDERWRVRITKRRYTGPHTRVLIDALTQHVDQPHVDLEHPDKTIHIELIGGHAGLALLKPHEHFSVNVVKGNM